MPALTRCAWAEANSAANCVLPSSSVPELVRYFFEHKDHLLERFG